MIIKNAQVFQKDQQFQKADILVEQERIISVAEHIDTENYSGEIIDGTDSYVIPGLIDIHFHGCMGYDFCDGTKEAIEQIIAYQNSKGITSICPATMTLPIEDITQICMNGAEYNKQQPLPVSPLVGINMEGPFISKEKKGAQNPAYIIEAQEPFLREIQEKTNNLIKLVAIAPEIPGALEVISNLHDQVSFSLAHTTANYEQAKAAFDAGACHVTHLYNAMPPFHHRDAGVIGAAFDTASCFVELITDGIHISPSVIRASFQLFGTDRVVLISDSMMACGMEDGMYSLGGQAVKVRGNLATLEDGTIAGSATNLFDCLLHAISVGIPAEVAIKAATLNPAKAIHIDSDYGTIEEGKIANLLLLDKNYKRKKVILQGKALTE